MTEWKLETVRNKLLYLGGQLDDVAKHFPLEDHEELTATWIHVCRARKFVYEIAEEIPEDKPAMQAEVSE